MIFRSLRLFSSLKTQITVFDHIVSKKIPSKPVYEDQLIYAFHDINPQAPVHVLIIPKNKNGLYGISYAQERHKQILGNLFVTASKIAKTLNLQNGYRLVINEGKDGGQTVGHLHIHLLGGRKLQTHC